MPTTTIGGHEIHIDDEGFMTEYAEWTEELGKELANKILPELLNSAVIYSRDPSTNGLINRYKSRRGPR